MIERRAGVPPCPGLKVADRVLDLTPVFDTFWHFAAVRQDVYFSRLGGTPHPWTDDPVLATYRFTNAYRAADRVSQFLIGEVIYGGPSEPDEVVFRTLLFKFFNRIDTWQALCAELGDISWSTYSFERYDAVLASLRDRGQAIYSAAYVIPPPSLGYDAKHRNHLRLLEMMMCDGLASRLTASQSLKEAFRYLRSYPSLGDFLAYQFVIDLNYSEVLDFDEMDFVVPGPGARDGIRKCFGPAADDISTDVIHWMADHQEEQFERVDSPFRSLWGRPLQLIDIQNLFCEVDKYARVVHPDVNGRSGRTRIKQIYREDSTPLDPWFPPKWGLNPQPDTWPIDGESVPRSS